MFEREQRSLLGWLAPSIPDWREIADRRRRGVVMKCMIA